MLCYGAFLKALRKLEIMFVNTALIDFTVLLQVDLQYLNEILRDGADPNSTDKYGQTALHEVR